MEGTIEFLDAVAAKHGNKKGPASDYRVAAVLGVSRTRLSNYRVGRYRFDDTMCLLVAKELDLDPAYVMACIAAERTADPAAKTVWTRAARTLRNATVAALAGFAIGPVITDANATTQARATAVDNIHYAY